MSSTQQPLQHKRANNDVDGESMYVEGALALLLQICRCVGVAPLRARRARAGWRVTLSPPLAVLQGFVMIFLDMALVAGVVLDFYQTPEMRIRVGNTFLKAFIWMSDNVLVMLIVSIAVYSAPAQIGCLKQVLKEMQQIKLDLNISAPSARSEKLKSISIVSLLTWTIVVIVMDFSSYFRMSFKKDPTWAIMSLYSSYYVANLQCVSVVMMWSLTVLTVYSAAAAVNRRLLWLRQANLISEPNASLQQFLDNPKSISTLVDCITIHANTGMGAGHLMYPSQVQATIHRLALAHERISEMMRQINETNGLMVMVILMSIFLRLVLTPYYLLSRLFNDEHDLLFEVFLPCAWTLVLMTLLLLTIEPCHWTHVQRERTNVLLSQLIVHMAPKCERVSNELDQFTKQIILNNVNFMPLGAYTLSRPLTAMMLGSITTYLIIIIQFDAISNYL